MLQNLCFCLMSRSKRSREASRSEDVVEFSEDELHCLILVNHVHCHVAVIPLWAHQCRPEHNADVLGGHSVRFRILQHSAGNERVDSAG